jgi:hypothetical protein
VARWVGIINLKAYLVTRKQFRAWKDDMRRRNGLVGFRQACWKSPGLITVVEMISELLAPSMPGEGLSSYIDLLISYISI